MAPKSIIRFVLMALLGCSVLAILAWPVPNPMKHPERKQVRFWHMWSGEWKDVVDKIVKRFNDSQTEYEVVSLSIPDSASTKFILGTAGGNPPDVMAQWEAVLPTWAENKMIVPLESLMTPAEWKNFKETAYPAVRKVGMYKGHLYGVTIGMNVSACYYRADQFRDAGLDPEVFPPGLEELDELGMKLTKKDKDGSITRLGYLSAPWKMLAPAFGGGFYDWKNEKLTLNTPQNLRALQYMVANRKKLGYENVVRFQSGFGSDSGAVWSFIGGAQTICFDGAWRVTQMGQYAPKLDYRLRPMPPPKGGVPLAGATNGNFMIVPSGARNIAGAWEFIKFWSGLSHPERAAEFYTWGGWLPLSPAVANTPIYQAYIRKYPQFKFLVDMMPSENLQPPPPIPAQQYVSDAIEKYQDLALRGSLSPEQAIGALEKDVNHELARRMELGYAG